MRRYGAMKKILVAAAAVAFSAGHALAQEFSARLNGFEELGAQNAESGAILSEGKGTLVLTLDKDAGTITYTLSYSDVGTTPPSTGTVTRSNIFTPRSASPTDTSCGVVTITAPVTCVA